VRGGLKNADAFIEDLTVFSSHKTNDVSDSPASGLMEFVRTPAKRREASADLRILMTHGRSKNADAFFFCFGPDGPQHPAG